MAIMKLRLNIDELNDDFFDDTRLLGITAPLKNYQFCLQLNNQLGYQFRLNPGIEIHLRKKDRSYYFGVYESREPNSFLVHYLYHNQFDGEYLLPEFRHMDFLWLMKGDWVDNDRCDWIRQSVKSLNGVQLVAELTNEQIRNKGNMVF
ncbi:MAG: IPExxxVDY family protein [Chitinophagaceae bacterium]|nr:IPExxxVDY family protein [Chitinophagaceae bacterium]